MMIRCSRWIRHIGKRHVHSRASPVRASLGSSSARASPSALSFRGKSPFTVLGVETTCDDTGLSLISSTGKIHGTVSASQLTVMAEFGGVHPLVAAREHTKALPALYQQLLTQTQIDETQIDGIAVAAGPGLSPCLATGVSWARDLARRLQCGLIGVNHLVAHAAVAELSHPNITFPCLTLLISGGHTEIWLMRDRTNITRLGQTLDDAVGEAYDKVGRLCNLTRNENESWGAALDRHAQQYDAATKKLPLLPLPLPMKHRRSADFSLSGLKTAMAAHVALQRRQNLDNTKSDVHDEGALTFAQQCMLAATFQQGVIEHIIDRTRLAIRWTRLHKEYRRIDTLILCGGVALNVPIRRAVKLLCENFTMRVLCPAHAHCVDNGVMIGWLGVRQFSHGHEDTYDLSFQPTWPAGETHSIENDLKNETTRRRPPLLRNQRWQQVQTKQPEPNRNNSIHSENTRTELNFSNQRKINQLIK